MHSVRSEVSAFGSSILRAVMRQRAESAQRSTRRARPVDARPRPVCCGGECLGVANLFWMAVTTSARMTKSTHILTFNCLHGTHILTFNSFAWYVTTEHRRYCVVLYCVAWCCVVLSGAVWCWVVLCGAVWCWEVLSSHEWCWEVLSDTEWCRVVPSGAVYCCVMLCILFLWHNCYWITITCYNDTKELFLAIKCSAITSSAVLCFQNFPTINV